METSIPRVLTFRELLFFIHQPIDIGKHVPSNLCKSHCKACLTAQPACGPCCGCFPRTKKTYLRLPKHIHPSTNSLSPLKLESKFRPVTGQWCQANQIKMPLAGGLVAVKPLKSFGFSWESVSSPGSKREN